MSKGVLWAVAASASGLVWVLEKLGLGGPKGKGFEDGVDRAARELGIEFDRRFGSSQTAVGRVGDVSVRVEIESSMDDRQNTMTYLVVTVESERIPRGLWFGEESGRGEDVLTGDPVFDDLVEVHGEPSAVLAVFDRELRQKVGVCVRSGGSLVAGRLRYRSLLRLPQADIPAVLRMAVDLATRLSAPEGGSLRQHLANNAVTDPLPGVRLLNLLQMQERFPGAAETMEASRADLTDPSPWVRLSAARFVGDAGVDALQALAKDREIADQAAAEAVSLLAERLPPERAGPLLVDVVKGRSGDARRQAIDALGGLRYGPALGPLIVVMEHADPRTAAAAARALGAIGDDGAETSLWAALGRKDTDLRLAAARALGQVGTVVSVAPLLAALDSRGLDTAARQAVRGAIASIQSRLVGAGAGQLTVASAESESGRLTLAGTEAGGLTLTDDREGRPPR